MAPPPRQAEPASYPPEVELRGTGLARIKAPGALRWRTQALLFGATLLTVFMAGAMHEWPRDEPFGALGLLTHLHRGWPFAVPLMAILLTHEFGHYFAARYHGVAASLPYFIPFPPLLSPIGTMGAVISMPERIRSRNALLDIGAAGPLAGMVVAVPVLLMGLAGSEVRLLEGTGLMEGQCLLYSWLKQLVLGPIGPGYDVVLSSTAFAGWVGLLLTMLNLLPIGQLDGGHIAYALFGKRQNELAALLHLLLVGAFVYNFMVYDDVAPGMVWLVWFALLMVLRRASGGVNHPPTEPGELSVGRRATAVACLALFVLLFMPTPMRVFGVASAGLSEAVQAAASSAVGG